MLLNPKFSNPLFLKLFCKGLLSNKSYQYKLLNFSNVIKLYIDNILPYINSNLYHYNGLIEAFSVLISEKFNFNTDIFICSTHVLRC